MWRCLHYFIQHLFTEHQLYSKHCLKHLEHKNGSARVPPVNEPSAQEPLPTDQTVADIFVHVPVPICACVCTFTCVCSGLIISILVAFFFQCKYVLRKKIFVKLRSPCNSSKSPWGSSLGEWNVLRF